MINQLSRNITRSLINNNIINFDDVSVYQYGLEVLLMTLAKFVGIFILASLTGYLAESILFVIAFGSIRVYAGGYHAGSVFNCFLLTVGFIVLDIVLCNLLNVASFPIMNVVFASLTLLIVYKYAPVEVITRPISENERVKFRKYSINLSVIYLSIITFISLFDSYTWYVGVFSIALLIEGLTLVVEKMRKEIVG